MIADTYSYYYYTKKAVSLVPGYPDPFPVLKLQQFQTHNIGDSPRQITNIQTYTVSNIDLPQQLQPQFLHILTLLLPIIFVITCLIPKSIYLIIDDPNHILIGTLYLILTVSHDDA